MESITKAAKIAAQIRAAHDWKPELLKELCELAGMSDEWDAADGDTFEAVCYAAADKLGVEII